MEPGVLACRCGQVALSLRDPARAVGVVCHCKDCRAYAHWLGESERVLDALGGTTIDVTLPDNVRVARGVQWLQSMSLSPRGALRWYASCCRSPVANMSRNPRFPFIGCAHADGGAAARGQGRDPTPRAEPAPRRLHIHTGGTPLPALGLSGQLTLMRFGTSMLWARLRGAHRHNPFFGAGGEPICAPRVLSKKERERCEAAALARA
jgi:hypothetical protein